MIEKYLTDIIHNATILLNTYKYYYSLDKEEELFYPMSVEEVERDLYGAKYKIKDILDEMEEGYRDDN